MLTFTRGAMVKAYNQIHVRSQGAQTKTARNFKMKKHQCNSTRRGVNNEIIFRSKIKPHGFTSVGLTNPIHTEMTRACYGHSVHASRTSCVTREASSVEIKQTEADTLISVASSKPMFPVTTLSVVEANSIIPGLVKTFSMSWLPSDSLNFTGCGPPVTLLAFHTLFWEYPVGWTSGASLPS